MNLRPLSERVWVEPIKETQEMVGSLHIPEAHQEKPDLGIVKAIGPLVKNASLKVGDLVAFGKYAGTPINIKGETFLLVQEQDLLAIAEA